MQLFRVGKKLLIVLSAVAICGSMTGAKGISLTGTSPLATTDKAISQLVAASYSKGAQSVTITRKAVNLVPVQSADPKTDSVAPQASNDPPPLPNTCSLSVIISKYNGYMSSDSLFSCSRASSESSMQGEIHYYAFLNWTNVAEKGKPNYFGARAANVSTNNKVIFNCIGSDKTNYRGYINVTITISGIKYQGHTLDESGNVACGTS